MAHLTPREQEILEKIKQFDGISPSHLLQELGGITKINALQKQLRALLDKGVVEKTGIVPRVFYRAVRIGTVQLSRIQEYRDALSNDQMKVIDSTFGFQGATSLVRGVEGFLVRFEEKIRKNMEDTRPKKIRRAEFEQSIKEAFLREASKYCEERETLRRWENELQLIDATDRIQKIMKDNTAINALYYSDFYSIPYYGKTLLGCLIHKCKGGDTQSIPFIEEVVAFIKKHVTRLIEAKNVTSIAYVPPTIKRKVQFMKLLEAKLDLPLPHIQINKTFKSEIVPQKSLSSLDQRIVNARETNILSVTTNTLRQVDHLLLIDDAVGSGATINEIAKKFKRHYAKMTVSAYAPVGSFKGFEVINEI